VSPLRGLGSLTRAFLLEMRRSKAAIFWTLAFPLFLLLLFGLIFGRTSPIGVTYLMPGIWTITVISSTFFGASMRMVQERENGLFRRFRVTPVSAVAVVGAYGLTTLITLAVSLVLQGIAGRLIFRINPAGSILSLALVLFAGLLAFIPLGLLVGSIARDLRSAPVITNLLFFPMMFLSGAAFPFFFLPDWVQGLARFLPSTYLMEALQGVVVRGETVADVLFPLAVLLVTFAAGVGVNALLFRWESSQPLRRRNLTLALGGLLALYALAYLVSPTLRMSAPPDDLEKGSTAPGAAGSSPAPGFPGN
jgi:ABC-2 type transport system permease protein